MHSNYVDEAKYNPSFYDQIDGSSVSSARIVVGVIQELFAISSVIDVGCGRGAWLSCFRERGVDRIKGIDSIHVDRDQLLIPSDCFEVRDLSKPFELSRGYDLALCLEVAEHLPHSMSRHLIEELTRSSPVVLFSAAIPGQGGTNHINEQWHDYWHKLFAHNSYKCFDILRHRLYSNNGVAWWFRQNMFIYASDAAVEKFDLLRIEQESERHLVPIASHVLDQFRSSKYLLRSAFKSAIRSIGKRASSFFIAQK